MLVKNAGIRGRCKLADRLQKDPYIAIDQPYDDILVYRVKREGVIFQRNLDLLSDPDSETAYDGGILDNSHCSSPEKVRRYKN